MILKKTFVEIRLWAGPVQLGTTGFVGSDSTVSIITEQRRVVSVLYFPASVYLYSCIVTIQHKDVFFS